MHLSGFFQGGENGVNKENTQEIYGYTAYEAIFFKETIKF